MAALGGAWETKLLRHDESILICLKGSSRFIETAACGTQPQCLFLQKRCKMMTVCRINDAMLPLSLHWSDAEGQKKQCATVTCTDTSGTTSECHSSQWGCHSPDIPTRRKKGTVPFQAGVDICPQQHSSLTPYVTHGETQHTPAAPCVRSKTNKLLQCDSTCYIHTETRFRTV